MQQIVPVFQESSEARDGAKAAQQAKAGGQYKRQVEAHATLMRSHVVAHLMGSYAVGGSRAGGGSEGQAVANSSRVACCGPKDRCQGAKG